MGHSPRLALFDQNLLSTQGHYLGYASVVARAARRRGVQPIIVGNRAAGRLGDHDDIVASLPLTYWQEMVPAEGRDGHQHLAQSAQLLADAVCGVCGDIDVDPGDVMFFPNANLAQTMGLVHVADRLGPRLPRLVLLFRRDSDEHGQLAGLGARIGVALLRQALADLRATPGGSRVRLLTDSRELSDDYAEATRHRFLTAPIPVDSRIAQIVRRPPGESVTLTYLGDARQEKGYDWLPVLADALGRALTSGRVRLVAQSNFNVQGGEPGIAEAREALRRYAHVTVFEEPLADTSYVACLESSDVALLPYRPQYYASRTSGVLAEAICAGLPAVVPAGTWLSGQLHRHCAGRAFLRADASSFCEAVMACLDDLPALHARAVQCRDPYAQFHNPDRLVEFVCGVDVLQRAGSH
jgi:hypothetical protein